MQPEGGIAGELVALGDERSQLNPDTAAEVANAVVFLGSVENSDLHASEIVVDGGAIGALAVSPRFVRGEPG